MDSLKPQPTPEAKLHFLDYWRIIRIRKTVIIAVFLLIAITATVVTFILPESYSSTARIKIENDVSDIASINSPQMNLGYDPYFIQTEFEIIQSETVLGKVIDALNLNVAWGKKYAGGETLQTDQTMRLLKQRLRLSPERNTKIIDITIYSEDRDEAARIANAIVVAYRDYRLNLRMGQTTGGINVLQASFDEDSQKIQAVQTNVDKLRNELNIIDPDPASDAPAPTLTPDELRHFEELRIDGQATYARLNEQLTGLKAKTPDQLRDVLPTTVQDTALTELLNNLNEAQQQLVKLKSDEGVDNPDVIRVQNLVAELNREIDARVTGIMAGLENNVQSEKATLDSLVTAVQDAKQKDQEEATRGQPYWEEKRKLENMLEFHKILEAKIDEDKLDQAIPKTAMMEVVDQARPGKDPVRPNKTLNIVLGIVVGLVVGVGLAFFIEYLDTSVKTIDDVERALQSPVLGVIPQNVGSLIDEGSDSQYAEAYRVLRTHILFSRKDEKLNTLAVVSAGAGEGKSTTTLNLATTFAQSGQRILVVDSDLRRPTLHKLLHVSNSLGLVSYLLKQNTLEEVIQKTNVPMLDFLASGKLPSSSMGILNSPRMKELITELKKRYDFIFFDSPPIMGVSDASILASEVDMTIQVIQYRRYPQPMNIRAKQMVEKVGGNLVGIVLNNINMSQDEGYYYYSGYYHGYYNYSQDEGEQEAAAQNDAAGSDKGGIKQKY
ncbi:MAG TPA: polysaccharide biosynthesis tyrosine autokinase [Verrucomicrobiae bacterium]|jgi:capsular exopolysaccharide synthesis family protein